MLRQSPNWIKFWLGRACKSTGKAFRPHRVDPFQGVCFSRHLRSAAEHAERKEQRLPGTSMIKTLVFARLCIHNGLKRQVQRQRQTSVQSLGFQQRWQGRLAERHLSRRQRVQRSMCVQAKGEDAAKEMNGGPNTSLAAVDRSLVEYTAQLANLQYTSDELEALVPAFQEMLRFVETLQGLEGSSDQGVDAAVWTPTGERSVNDLRPDVVEEFPERDAIRDQFPSAERGLLRVPRVIGNDQD